MNKKIVIGETISSAWEILKKNMLVFVGVFVAFGIISFFVSSILGGTSSFMPNTKGMDLEELLEALSAIFGPRFFFSTFLTMILGYYFQLGFYKMILQAIDGNEPTLNAFAVSFRKLGNAILAGLLSSFVIVIGLILCVIPGIYLAVRFMFFMYYITDQDCGPIEALKKSWERTDGMVLDLVLLYIVCILLIILGLFACCIGIFVTIPLVYITLAIVYRKGTSLNSETTEEVGLE